MQFDGYPPNRLDPLKSGVVLGALGWSAMLSTLTTQSQPRNGFSRLEAAGVDAKSQPANVATAPWRQRLRRLLDRFRRRQAAIQIAQASPR